MRAHWQYLSYVLRHKWYVFVECCRLGIFWRGLVHDLSKFRPDEWFPYAEYFNGGPHIPAVEMRDYHFRLGLRSKEEVERDFDTAWLHHIHRNPHHHQYWVLREDSGQVKCLPMPEQYLREMLADWRGAGKAQRNLDDTRTWYLKNRQKMRLHPSAEAWLEEMLGGELCA